MAVCNRDSCPTQQQAYLPRGPCMILQIKIGIEDGQVVALGLTGLGIRPCRLMVDRPHPGQDEPDADNFNEADGFSQDQGR